MPLAPIRCPRRHGQRRERRYIGSHAHLLLHVSILLLLLFLRKFHGFSFDQVQRASGSRPRSNRHCRPDLAVPANTLQRTERQTTASIRVGIVPFVAGTDTVVFLTACIIATTRTTLFVIVGVIAYFFSLRGRIGIR